jgi:hypothetical protein
MDPFSGEKPKRDAIQTYNVYFPTPRGTAQGFSPGIRGDVKPKSAREVTLRGDGPRKYLNLNRTSLNCQRADKIHTQIDGI